ncbi:MAG: hypothetical protein Q8M03_08260 [Legionella sp.]|nr:hypothetical protein [Legionella sp.]
MKLEISHEDYIGIASNVKTQFEKLPGNEFAQADLILGPEFLADTLRVSTPKTSIKFTDDEKNYLKAVRAQIQKEAREAKAALQQLPPPETTEQKKVIKFMQADIRFKAITKLKQLNSIVLFGQLLFSQSGCLYFLDKIQCEEGSDLFEGIKQLKHIAESGSADADTYSKKDVLTQRKNFSQKIQSLLSSLAQAPLDKEEKQKIERDLYKAQGFYFQLNDLNFKYANAPSRRYSTFINTIEKLGSRLALGASMIAIAATALSFIPGAAPIAIPIATAASVIALCIGMPIAVKKIGTMICNAIKYKAAPTKAELINAALFGLCLLLAGSGGIVHGAIDANFLGKFAFFATKIIKAGKNLGQASLGTIGQITQNNQKKNIQNIHTFFQVKTEVKNKPKLKSNPEIEMDEFVNPPAGH